jgi:hypothetical protein
MLALIGRGTGHGWTQGRARFAVAARLRRMASAVGWGLILGAVAMLAQIGVLLGALYVAGIISV